MSKQSTKFFDDMMNEASGKLAKQCRKRVECWYKEFLSTIARKGKTKMLDTSILGKEVKDKVSGFKGTVVAVTTWLNGCIRVNVAPKVVKKDGALPDTQCFDIEQVEIVGDGLTKKKKEPTGGPMPTVRQHTPAKR